MMDPTIGDIERSRGGTGCDGVEKKSFGLFRERGTKRGNRKYQSGLRT